MKSDEVEDCVVIVKGEDHMLGHMPSGEGPWPIKQVARHPN